MEIPADAPTKLPPRAPGTTLHTLPHGAYGPLAPARRTDTRGLPPAVSHSHLALLGNTLPIWHGLGSPQQSPTDDLARPHHHQYGGANALRLWPTAHGRRTLSTGLRPAGIGAPRAQFHHTLVGKSRPHRRQRRGQPGSHTTETRILRPERLPEMPLRRRIPQKKVSTIAHRTYLSTYAIPI